MGKYDLSKISRDELRDFLSRAKDAMVEYTRCQVEIEKIEMSITVEKGKI